MNKKFRIISLFIILTLMMSFMVACGDGKDGEDTGKFPAKSINMIVPYGAGGSTDVFARLAAKELEKVLGETIVVNNVSGGGGAVGFADTLSRAADGYTVTISNGASLTLGGIGGVDFEYNDFDNLGRVIVEDLVVGVHKDSPINSIEDLKNYEKETGKKVKYGFAGLGGFTHLASEKFIKELGIDVESVGYESGSEAVAGLLGGFVDVIAQQPAEILSQYEAGEFKALAIMGDKRHPSFEDVPTLEEEGIDLVLYQWRGISGPKGMPEDVKEIWIDALTEVANNEDFQKEVVNVLGANVNFIKGAEFEKWLDEEASWIYPLIEELGLKE